MSIAELELEAPEFSGVPATEERPADDGNSGVKRPRFSFTAAGGPYGGHDVSALRPADAAGGFWPSGLPRPVRLEAKGPEGSSSAVEMPLRIDRVGGEWPPRFRLSTPPDVRGTELAISIDLESAQFEMQFAVRLTDRPINEALAYARFLRALHSEGSFSIVLLEPEETPLADAALPINERHTEDAPSLDWDIRFFERLREVEEATGTEMLSPPDVTEEDLLALDRVEAVIRAGWVAQRLDEFTAWLSPEGARLVLGHGGDVVEGLSLTSEGERVPLFGREIPLGPSTRWIAKARLMTPLEELERRLASDTEGGVETRWAPLDAAPMHVFFAEWPKPSLERVTEQIKGFEREYGMSSKRFKRAWDEGKPKALLVEGGDAWAALVEARDHLKRAGRKTAR